MGAVAALCGLTACVTNRASRQRFLERVPPPQALLEASTTFGGGALEVRAWLGPTVRLRKEREHPSSHGGRFTAEPARQDEVENDDPFNEPRNAGRYTNEEITAMYGRVNYEYVTPPRLALTFTLINRTQRPISFRITDANSALGDFAPRPESMTLGPGQEGAVDPMLSTIQDNFDKLEVSITLHLGGSRETQVITLRPAARPPPP